MIRQDMHCYHSVHWFILCVYPFDRADLRYTFLRMHCFCMNVQRTNWFISIITQYSVQGF